MKEPLHENLDHEGRKAVDDLLLTALTDLIYAQLDSMNDLSLPAPDQLNHIEDLKELENITLNASKHIQFRRYLHDHES